MRIAFYAPRASHLDPDLARGGDPIFLEALFGALRERGHEVRVVSRLNVRDLWRGRVPARRLITEAVAIRREMKRFSPDGWLIYDASRTYPDLFGWWQRPRRYVLFGAHDWQSKRIPRLWRWLLALAFRKSLHRAHHVSAVRPASADRLRAEGVARERLSVVPHAPKSRPEIPSQEEARRSLRLPTGAPIALCATRFTGERQTKEGKTEMICALVAAVGSLPREVILVIVGEGPGRGRIEAAIEQIRHPERIWMHGAVTNDDLTLFYAACDLYAYPHALDRPWMSVLEAQGCGRPVVTIRTPSTEITVEHGRTGLLAADLREFRTYLAALASDRERCASMGRAARAYIAETHSIEVRARQVERWLSKPVCARSRASRKPD